MRLATLKTLEGQAMNGSCRPCSDTRAGNSIVLCPQDKDAGKLGTADRLTIEVVRLKGLVEVRNCERHEQDVLLDSKVRS